LDRGKDYVAFLLQIFTANGAFVGSNPDYGRQNARARHERSSGSGKQLARSAEVRRNVAVILGMKAPCMPDVEAAIAAYYPY
jgi:hypothetical protein